MTVWFRDNAFWGMLAAGVLLLVAWRMTSGHGPLPGPAELLLVALAYPVLEELLFRGVIQPTLDERLRGRRLGPLTWANLLTSLLFAVAHAPAHGLAQALLVLGPSLVFGLFRDRHRTVVSPMLLHVAWNAAALLLLGRSVHVL